MNAEAATSLRRGVAILLAFESGEASSSGGLGVTEIAGLIGREKSQVSRTLKTLAESGFVERDPDTLRYRLGWRLFALAAQAGERQLLDQAGATLRAIVGELDERAHLSVLQGSQVLTVLSESPTHAVQTSGWVGRAVPAYCTSSGRALLFDHDQGALAAVFEGVELGRHGPNAPRNVDELHERVVAARSRGYAAVDDEFELGLVAVAAPVYDFRGRIIAALNVSAPKFRFARRLRSAGVTVKDAADELSSRLGRPHEQPAGAKAAGR
ncbi:MAG: IclR family transcriptional regulator [Actinobacteria bacterium]|nr:IclR family transcriptional regulator [Actinomycetota bacterium]